MLNYFKIGVINVGLCNLLLINMFYHAYRWTYKKYALPYVYRTHYPFTVFINCKGRKNPYFIEKIAFRRCIESFTKLLLCNLIGCKIDCAKKGKKNFFLNHFFFLNNIILHVCIQYLLSKGLKLFLVLQKLLSISSIFPV